MAIALMIASAVILIGCSAFFIAIWWALKNLYTPEQVHVAFWRTFYKSGAHWFHQYSDSRAQEDVERVWDLFLNQLENANMEGYRAEIHTPKNELYKGQRYRLTKGANRS